jgi:targeting protein for Xklp2
MQREMQERERKEKEEAQMRIFRAQPVLKEYAMRKNSKLSNAY